MTMNYDIWENACALVIQSAPAVCVRANYEDCEMLCYSTDLKSHTTMRYDKKTDSITIDKFPEEF